MRSMMIMSSVDPGSPAYLLAHLLMRCTVRDESRTQIHTDLSFQPTRTRSATEHVMSSMMIMSSVDPWRSTEP